MVPTCFFSLLELVPDHMSDSLGLLNHSTSTYIFFNLRRKKRQTPVSFLQFVTTNVTYSQLQSLYVAFQSPQSSQVPTHITQVFNCSTRKSNSFTLNSHLYPTLYLFGAIAMEHRHFVLVTFPGQGHINPTLQFAKCLLRLGTRVTLLTTTSICRRMTKARSLEGLTLAEFSDGYDDGLKLSDDLNHYMSELKRCGSHALSELITQNASEGRPITCVVYTTLLPWAGQVARDLHVPSAFLWIQPAIVLDIYYYYFKGYGDLIRNKSSDPSCPIELPGLPPLISRDLPSFFVTSNEHTFALPIFQEQQEFLDQETNPRVLVNTFDALEPDTLKAVEKLNLIAVGPLVPSAFLAGKDPSATSSGVDLFQSSKDDYIEWLNSKPKSSVIYVSFGSISVLTKRQMEEIARGLLQSQRPFLWVIRASQNGEEEKEEDKPSCREELERQGMIVPWCSQVEVLSHPSVGCFVTHCGWNSSLESLVSGVPVVAFPQWTDQGTNAKMIEDVWETGVRVEGNEEGIVEEGEIKKCLEIVMGGGERGEELRRNAKKWKDLAREAVKEGGSSDKNLKAFVDEVAQARQ